VEHNGQVYGPIAPMLEQGKVLAATITGNRGPIFQGWTPAAKLKIMGVDAFSAGEFQEREGTEVVRHEDPAMGVYKKLLVRDNRLAGVVLVGDASDSNRYMEWLRHNSDLVLRRRNLLFPEPEPDRGRSRAELPDSETVCGCMGVSKGAIIQTVHQRGINTLPQLEEATRASTGCGSCTAATTVR
jgi:nitrite reductase (NADH) large subunit